MLEIITTHEDGTERSRGYVDPGVSVALYGDETMITFKPMFTDTDGDVDPPVQTEDATKGDPDGQIDPLFQTQTGAI